MSLVSACFCNLLNLKVNLVDLKPNIGGKKNAIKNNSAFIFKL